MSVSVVLPTYNEAASIVAVVEAVLAAIKGDGRTGEVLVVDDGSPDGTADVVERHFSDRDEVVVIRRQGPRGLAYSIRDGLDAARSDLLVVMDADFNHDPAELPALLAPTDDFDIVSGSRFVAGGDMYSRKRWIGSCAMNLFARAMLRTPITDCLAGYFAIRRSVLDSLPAERIFWGYGDYFIRLLWYARADGRRILEVPAVYRPREAGASKTAFLRTTLRYGFEIVRLALMG